MADGASEGENIGTLAVGSAPASAVLFGEFQMLSPAGVPVPLANRRARALLAMLCLEPDQTIARETLTQLLWPGRFEAQARASLRQCLVDLGKALEASGCAILSVSRDRVGLVHDTLQTDLGDLEAALLVGDVALVTTLLHRIGTKPLLDQPHLGVALGDWLDRHRDEIEHRLGAAIADAVDRMQRAGNAATATRLLDAWAIRSKPVPVRAPIVPQDGRTRVAVLPFQSAGAGESDYFVDGMADELISTLGQVPQLLIAGRTSSFHFRDSKLPLPDIASALGVSHLIEGSVQRQGERVACP